MTLAPTSCNWGDLGGWGGYGATAQHKRHPTTAPKKKASSTSILCPAGGHVMQRGATTRGGISPTDRGGAETANTTRLALPTTNGGGDKQANPRGVGGYCDSHHRCDHCAPQQKENRRVCRRDATTQEGIPIRDDRVAYMAATTYSSLPHRGCLCARQPKVATGCIDGSSKTRVRPSTAPNRGGGNEQEASASHTEHAAPGANIKEHLMEGRPNTPRRQLTTPTKNHAIGGGVRLKHQTRCRS
jgi:hypothetical protein